VGLGCDRQECWPTEAVAAGQTCGHITVSLSAVEKAEAVHGEVPVPRTAVVSAEVAPAGTDAHSRRGN